MVVPVYVHGIVILIKMPTNTPPNNNSEIVEKQIRYALRKKKAGVILFGLNHHFKRPLQVREQYVNEMDTTSKDRIGMKVGIPFKNKVKGKMLPAIPCHLDDTDYDIIAAVNMSDPIMTTANEPYNFYNF